MRPDDRIDRRFDPRRSPGFERSARPDRPRDDARVRRTGGSSDRDAARLDEYIRSDDGADHLKLVDRNASVRDKAAALEQVLLLLERRGTGADASTDAADAAASPGPPGVVRRPRDEDRRIRCEGRARCDGDGLPRRPPVDDGDDGDDGSDPGEDDGEDDGKDDGDAEVPTPPVVRPPYDAPSAPDYFSRYRNYFHRRVAMSPCRFSLDPLDGAYGFGYGLLRNRDPLWQYASTSVSRAYDAEYDEWLLCSGVWIGPTFSWDAYASRIEARREAEKVECAQITVQRHDDAAVRFRVKLPALGAETLDELRNAINGRLSRGETVSLDITLKPEDVEEVSVEACDGEDEEER